MDAIEKKNNCMASVGKGRNVDRKKNESIFSYYYHFNRCNAHKVKISSNVLRLGEEMLLNIELAVIT